MRSPGVFAGLACFPAEVFPTCGMASVPIDGYTRFLIAVNSFPAANAEECPDTALPIKNKVGLRQLPQDITQHPSVN